MSSDPQPPRLRIGIVGAGRVGAVLGAALRRTGHEIVGVSAVSDLSRLRADALLPGVPVLAPPEIADAAELVLLAVPDDVLPDLVAGLVGAGALSSGQFVVHTSGRHGI
ncbi:MAG: NAD(P)-binding domain-containing protein, partial [Candidatus Nanopelagicales bacterium]